MKKPNGEFESVEEYETRIRHGHQSIKEAAKRSGIACPECHKEMAWMGQARRINTSVYEMVRCLNGCDFDTEVIR